jgi:hypothetical protein
MPRVIDSAGHPRDMGSDQGAACRSEVREELARARLPLSRSRLASLCAFASGRVRGSGRGRELLRHYTHLSERIDGLARAAGVPVDSLIDLHLRAAAGGERAGELGREAIVMAGAGDSGATLVRGLPAAEGAGCSWIVRRSHPEVGFHSLEVTLPWLVSAVAGVNSAGLCALLAAIPNSDPGSAPPSLLLVQECLQRFASLDGARDWCLERPASGDLTLLLADATGAQGRIEFRGRERLFSRSCDSAEPKALGEHPSPESLAPPGAPPPQAWLRLDAAKRQLRIESVGAKRESILLEL